MRALRLPLLAAGLALAAACGPSGPPAESSEPTAGARSYEIRGVVRALPPAGAADPQLTIRHEAVPDLVDIAGRTTGMEAMTMKFRTADGVDLSGLQTGTKVTFRLDIDWDRSPPVLVTEIRVLPPETELTLGE